jgi:hypothetical protein
MNEIRAVHGADKRRKKQWGGVFFRPAGTEGECTPISGTPGPF